MTTPQSTILVYMQKVKPYQDANFIFESILFPIAPRQHFESVQFIRYSIFFVRARCKRKARVSFVPKSQNHSCTTSLSLLLKKAHVPVYVYAVPSNRLKHYDRVSSQKRYLKINVSQDFAEIVKIWRQCTYMRVQLSLTRSKSRRVMFRNVQGGGDGAV